MKKEKKGKVWIAGAGPGDAGLLTVRTAHLMRQADVIVYDALISAEILSLIPPDTRTIYVGKRSDHHLVPQEEINQILVREAELGNHVLRLKGGDPFVFGRGGEEAQMLRNAGIDFEIVPGVTSGVAVPAYAGIPVTHRDYTSSFHVITGHARKGGLTRIDYKALVRLGGTLIFLMGVTALPEICTKLREAGMPGETPAAVIQDGTLACQKSVRSDLIHLPEHVLEEKIKAPAIIVVGQVCALGDEFSWMKKRPLGGRQILVTRPEERNRSFAESLRSLGAQVIGLPAIRTKELKKEEDRERIRKAISRISKRAEAGTAWIVFTSAAGVDVFFSFLKTERIDVRSLWRARFAVIGTGTGKALERKGILPDLIPDVYEAGELGNTLAKKVTRGDLVAAFRAREASEELFPPIREQGADCLDIPVYETFAGVTPAWVERILAQFEEGKIDAVTFTSASTVRGFVNMMDGRMNLKHVRALCIGRKTEEEARSFGMWTITSQEATVESMIETLLEAETI